MRGKYHLRLLSVNACGRFDPGGKAPRKPGLPFHAALDDSPGILMHTPLVAS